jgi:replication factor C small subunit
MNEFIEFESKSVEKAQSLWCEKYRPDAVENYICSDQLRGVLIDFLTKKDIPHLLFYGSAGTGKTTLAKILTKNIPCDVMYVNASDNTGVDFVRDKIRPFAAAMGFNDLKVVILDESDYMSSASQASLRNLMETYSKTTRFILTCNYVEKIISPLISRCQVFQIEPPAKKDVALYTKNILDTETIKYELTDLKTVVDSFYPDIRKIVNFIQQSSTNGTLKLVKNQSVNFDLKTKLINLLNNSKTNGKVFNDIRQLIADSGTKSFDELYSELYDKCGEFAPGKEISVIIEVAEYMYQSNMVVDKEITFMACIAKLIKTIVK